MKKVSGPAAGVTPYCRGILVNAEDSDGQVEGSIEVFTRQSESLTLLGERLGGHVTYVRLLSRNPSTTDGPI